MAGRCSTRTACTLLALTVRAVEAGLWDAVSGAATSVGGAVSGAASSAAKQVSKSAEDLAESAPDLAGSALEQVEHQACDLKSWEDTCSVNATLSRQIQLDCEALAARSPYMHDNIFASCITMGLYNINRTLERQLPKIKEDCLQALREAPGDMTGALSRFSEQTRQLLTERVGLTLQATAPSEAEQKPRDGEDAVQLKFAAQVLIFAHDGAATAAPALLVLALALALVGLVAGLRATRRRHTREEEELLVSETEV